MANTFSPTSLNANPRKTAVTPKPAKVLETAPPSPIFFKKNKTPIITKNQKINLPKKFVRSLSSVLTPKRLIKTRCADLPMKMNKMVPNRTKSDISKILSQKSLSSFCMRYTINPKYKVYNNFFSNAH